MNDYARLLIATRNNGKVAELRQLLGDLPVRLMDLSQFPALPESAEPHETFVENARQKARYYAAATRTHALADDSGLEVEALDGAPGVRSARYGGANLSDVERTAFLLHALAATSDVQRRARFVCAVVVARPDESVVCEAVGHCDGHIVHAPRGTNGFGYDPVFVPDGFDTTFAEMNGSEKDRISHRARALRALRSRLADPRGGFSF